MSTPETKPDPWTVWRTGFVSRWHSGEYAPELAHTQDYICGHSGRMAVLAIHYWGLDVSRDLLMAIALHDVGESGPGDVSHGAKRDDPWLAAAVAAAESDQMRRLGLPCGFLMEPLDLRRLEFLDRLDSYYYVRLRAPALLEGEAWMALRRWLYAEGLELGVTI
jgi:hypothetical protein